MSDICDAFRTIVRVWGEILFQGARGSCRWLRRLMRNEHLLQ